MQTIQSLCTQSHFEENTSCIVLHKLIIIIKNSTCYADADLQIRNNPYSKHKLRLPEAVDIDFPVLNCMAPLLVSCVAKEYVSFP